MAELPNLEGSRKIAPCGRTTVLYSVGDRADCIFFLESGLVKEVKRSEEGRELLVSLIRSGEWFGEQAVISDGVRECSAQAIKESVVHIIPAEPFRRMCHRKPDMWLWIADLLDRRLREQNRKLELMAFHRVDQRILYLLIDMAEIFGTYSAGKVSLSVPLSQAELASLVGATRETTSTILNTLERRGLLRLGRRLLHVPSLEALRAAAAQRAAV